MTFYVYLISGHSHMLPDRVVSWSKKSLAQSNLYGPDDIVNRMNTVKSIKARFIDHESPTRSCYTGWDKVLNKSIKNLPAGFRVL